MELELKTVAGIQSCYVSLPLLFITTLQSTCAGVIPHFLALELRFRDNRIWHVAWSGSASSSSAIEVGRNFADCIDVSDRTVVQVRAICNLPEARKIVVDPDTSDDWEVMELNSERAEASLLAQVGIVTEGMKFPLWLSGGAVARFNVVSIFPQKSVVRLVSGTEVIVAPKNRTRNTHPHVDSSAKAYNKDNLDVRAQLRVQEDSTRILIQTGTFSGVELGISVTSVSFVNPKTAKYYLMESHQSVVIVPSSAKTTTATSNHERNVLKKTTGPRNDNGQTRKPSQTVLLLLSDDVSEGHIVISQPLCTFLRVDLHSWVLLKCYNERSPSDISFISLSPCQFKVPRDDDDLETNSEMFKNSKVNKTDTAGLEVKKDTFNETVDLSILEEFISCLFFGSSGQHNEDSTAHSRYRSGLRVLLQAWLSSLLHVITSNSGVKAKSFVLGNKTLLHFEVKGFKPERPIQDKKIKLKESVDIFYVLTLSDGGSHGEEGLGFEFDLNGEDGEDDLGGLDVLMEKMNFGEALVLSSVGIISPDKGLIPAIFPLTWMEKNVSLVANRLSVLLSFESQSWYSNYDVPLPGHILIYGPRGSGKTSLSKAVSKVVEQRRNCLAHIIFISCSKLASEKAQTVTSAFSGYISEALNHAPCLVVFDDIDSIILAPSDSRGFLLSSPDSILSEFLREIMDEYAVKRKHCCGIGPITFLATAQSLENVPHPLRSSGRFDFHVQLPSFSAPQRCAILKCELQKRSLQCSDSILSSVSSKCDGYDAYDLEILVDRAVHAAVGRFVSPCSPSANCEKPILVEDDFSNAMREFIPVSMRDIAKHSSEGNTFGWENVGGLFKVKNAIKEMIELPSKFPSVYSKAPLRMRSNALLYGPPGCGKTHIVAAAASACSLRLISVRGPELLNKYIGASEQAVRDIFSKAASAAPCLLFFDEFDSIVPSRGHDNTGVTDRVVNQFLTELDGVEALVGVFVFAATSRPDLLDAALLRPGRLDHLLLCDFPSQNERLDILKLLSGKVKMEVGVDLEAVAAMTEGYSGADLESIFSDAQLKVVNDCVSAGGGEDADACPAISDPLLRSLTSRARRSVSEAERRRLDAIYSRFRDSRSPSGSQVDEDQKGKRVTLA